MKPRSEGSHRMNTRSEMLAKVKKELPEYLIIATLLWAVKIASDYKGFHPITWTIRIILTALFMYVIVSAESVALEFIWSFIKRIKARL